MTESREDGEGVVVLVESGTSDKRDVSGRDGTITAPRILALSLMMRCWGEVLLLVLRLLTSCVRAARLPRTAALDSDREPAPASAAPPSPAPDMRRRHTGISPQPR
jgi:hypothetical protein